MSGDGQADTLKSLVHGACVCGVDLGSLRTPSYVAWLQGCDFVLDMYVLSEKAPFPAPPPGWPEPRCVAVDAPQGLPATGARRRRADAEAKTPTSVLPQSRAELAGWKLYRGPLEAGVNLFWWAHARSLASVFGLTPTPAGAGPVLCETYPRYVIERLGVGRSKLPSKVSAAVAYVEAVWPRLLVAGFRCPSVIRPTHDQLDAMVCAIAAQACATGAAHRVGSAPVEDRDDKVLREGFIVTI